MKLLFILTFLFVNFFGFSQWIQIDHGFKDDFTGIQQYDSAVFLTGKKGFYFNLESAFKKSSWKRFEVNNNSELTTVYNQTAFYNCILETDYVNNKKILACGQDTINKKAQLFLFDIKNQTCELLYTGPENSKFNDIGKYYNSSTYHIVGDNGFYVSYDLKGKSSEIIYTGIQYHLTSIIVGESISYITSKEGILTVNFSINSNKINIDSFYKDIKSIYFSNTYTKYYLGKEAYRNGELLKDYKYGQLNANVFSNGYLGTDHGIFYLTNNIIFEWIPSSKKYNITDLSCINDVKYACGSNSVLLCQKIFEGSIPYFTILEKTHCVGNNQIQCLNGSLTNAKWYLNDSLINTTGKAIYTTTSLNFKKAGDYKLKVLYNNNKYQDSLLVDYKVVSIPKTDKNITSDNNVICHKGNINVSIQNSENNVYYTLNKITQPTYGFQNIIEEFGKSTNGNGSTISFKSNTIDKSTSFVIVANNSLAQCSSKFTDSIKIKVENTKSNFHTSKVNASRGESVQFYQHSTDASTYKWILNDNGLKTEKYGDFTDYSFNSNGKKNVTLISISKNNCTDTLSKQSVFINDITNRNTWENSFSTKNRYGSSEFYVDIFKVNNGVLFVSDSIKGSLKGQDGDSLNNLNKVHLLVKYDLNGRLKWVVKASNMKRVNVDKKGFIYVITGGGSIYNKTYLIDNSGDSIVSQTGNTLFKLDSLGKVCWKINSLFYDFKRIEIDNNQNIYSLGVIQNVSKFALIQRNEIKIDSIYYAGENSNIVMKINPNGYISWYTYINGFDIKQVKFDQKNNIYYLISKKYSALKIEYYSTDFTYYSNQYVTKDYLFKCDSNGVFIWCNLNALNYTNKSISTNNFDVDEHENIYLCGNVLNDLTSDNVFFAIKTSNNWKTIRYKQSGIYLAKLNRDGIPLWMKGSHKYSNSTINNPKIILSNNEVVLYGFNERDLVFINPDSTKYIDTINSLDLYVSFFDSIGNFKKILKTPLKSITSDFQKMYIEDNIMYLLLGNYRYYTQNKILNIFNKDVNTSFNDNSNTILKISVSDLPNKYINFPKYITSIKDTLCNNSSYQFPSGPKKISAANNYLDTILLKSTSKLDSLIIYNLKTIHLNDSVYLKNDSTLIADEKNASSYQWLDCNNGYKSLENSKQSLLTPTNSGNFALLLKNKYCIDTSKCFQITLTPKTSNLDHKNSENEIKIFPNPSNGLFNINLNQNYEQVEVSLLDIYGKYLRKNQYYNISKTDYQIDEIEGVYFIEINNSKGHTAIFKVIKK